MRPHLVKAGCAAAAILVAVILVEAQEPRSRPTLSSTKPASVTDRPSGKSFEEEARELAHVLETNPMLEIKSKRMSPFSEVVLLRYVALGQKKMPMLVAAKQGRSSQVEALLKRVGAKIYFAAPEIDYFRCVVDIKNVVTVFESPEVLDVHLGMKANIGNEFDGDGFPAPKYKAPRTSVAQATAEQQVSEPADKRGLDEQLSHRRVGLDKFWVEHPTYDGRGVTIGQIDGGSIQDSELLTVAKDLQGQPLPKLAGIHHVFDYDFEGGWTSVTDLINPDVAVQLSAPIAADNSTLVADGKVYTVPGPGLYRVGVWRSAFERNRTAYPLLYTEATGQIRLDAENNSSFADNKPFGDFNTTHIPFSYTVANKPAISGVFQVRPDRSIAVILQAGHATMSGVAAAGNAWSDSGPIGAAPSAQLSVASMHSGVYPYIEAALRMSRDPKIDIINFSATSTAYQEAQPFVAKMLNRIASRYRKPIFAAAGNSGAQLSSVIDIATADQVIAVGGYATLPHGGESRVDTTTSHGPALSGQAKPNIVIPSPVITGWSYLKKCGEQKTDTSSLRLPRCLAPYSFTSFYAPYAAGVAADLLSAAKQERLLVDGWQLRYALESSAHFLASSPANAQGNGAIDVRDAWNVMKSVAGRPSEYFTAAYIPADDAGTPMVGRGVFQTAYPAARQYRAICFRVIGHSGHDIKKAEARLVGNDGTFAVARALTPMGPTTACLDLTIAPTTIGLHSALIRLDLNGRMLATTQATVVAPARLEKSNAFSSSHEGIAVPDVPDRWWFELPDTSFVPVVRFDVLQGEGTLICSPGGKMHSVYTAYYAPRMFPRNYPDAAIQHGPGSYWSVLDIPRSRLWQCTATAVTPATTLSFRAIAYAVGHAELTADSAVTFSTGLPIKYEEGQSPVVEIEPVLAVLNVASADGDSAAARTFWVPAAAGSLRVEVLPGSASSPAWTLFRCPEGRCRAWYSSALDRASSAGFTVHRPQAGEWRLALAGSSDAVAIRAIITGAPIEKHALLPNSANRSSIRILALPASCSTLGCLLRAFDRSQELADRSAPIADFPSPSDRDHRRPYDFGTLLIQAKEFPATAVQ